MRTLISCVGDSDPIRNFHDGPLLHIARVQRPEKIVLIHTERTVNKGEALTKAIYSIPDYEPEIVVEPTVIKNSEVFMFDRVFELLFDIIQKYHQSEDEILLNLTSSTPQIISAMFSINRITDMNVNAYQVATPVQSSNAGIRHENSDDIDVLISLNNDNSVDFTSRVIKDSGQSFNTVLMKRTVLDLLAQYDYEGIFQLSTTNKFLSNKKRALLNNRLDAVLKTIKFQNVLPEIQQSKMGESVKLLLNSYLILDLQSKRNLTSEALIRAKNFGEFAAELFLNERYPNLVFSKDNRAYLNGDVYPEIEKHLEKNRFGAKKTWISNPELNIHLYIQIFDYLTSEKSKYPESKELSTILSSLRYLQSINAERNKVAHGLRKIDQKLVRTSRIITCSRELIKSIHDIDEEWFHYFDNLNNEIQDLIKS